MFTAGRITPIQLFEKWYSDAVSSGMSAPEAMTLATATRSGIPSARIVLFKGLSRGGFTFFTNFQSRKGNELKSNPRAALVFYWEPLQRQIRIEGKIEPLSATQSNRYFASRDRSSQIGAWASDQSQLISGREELEAKVRHYEIRFGKGDVPRPPHWGGFRLVPQRIEFWQGQAHRLHDRLTFTRSGSRWTRSILSP